MRIPSLLIATALLAPGTWAQDEGFLYLQLGMGGVFSESVTDESTIPTQSRSFDPGYNASIAIGHVFAPGGLFDFEAQAELYYQYFTVKAEDLPQNTDDTAKAFAGMINGIIDWNLAPQYSIYVGAGIGYANTISYRTFDSGPLIQRDKDGLAYQGLFGFRYNLGGNYEVRLGGRYFRTEPVTIVESDGSGDFDLDPGQFAVEATFRWGL